MFCHLPLSIAATSKARIYGDENEPLQVSGPIYLAALATFPRCSAAHRTAARRPFGTSTPNQMTRLAEVQRMNKNGKPSQLLPDLLMIAWIMFGPIIDDEVFDSPNRLKN